MLLHILNDGHDILDRTKYPFFDTVFKINLVKSSTTVDLSSSNGLLIYIKLIQNLFHK